MAVSSECPHCHTPNGLARKVCSKCNAKIPLSGLRYWLRFWDHDGVSKKESLGKVTLKEAKDAEQQRIVDAKSKKRVGSELTWKDLSDRYLTKLQAENASNRYTSDNRLYFERFMDYFGRDNSISETTPALIRSFRSDLRTAGLSEATCDRHLAAGKAAWNYSVDQVKN
ncbi:MAG: hypothetical protein WC647_13355 [Desulfomonilaceae bacterium]|jgi:hypothetical protein